MRCFPAASAAGCSRWRAWRKGNCGSSTPRASVNRLARDLRVPVTRMSEIVNGRRSITAEFWVNLQSAYDLDLATRASAERIKRDVHPREAA